RLRRRFRLPRARTRSMAASAMSGPVRPGSSRFTSGLDRPCGCIPPPPAECGNAALGACGTGICPDDQKCDTFGPGPSPCRCVPESAPPPCGNAGAPACDGFCPSGRACLRLGSTCSCWFPIAPRGGFAVGTGVPGRVSGSIGAHLPRRGRCVFLFAPTPAPFSGFGSPYVVHNALTASSEPLPELSEVNGDAGLYTERLKGLVTSRGIVRDCGEDLGTRRRAPQGGRIE